jgi:hypothetical protein
MCRRLIAALLFTLALALPATASAQAPDERAAARAFADITLPAAHEIAATTNALTIEFPTCKSQRRLARGTEAQQARMFEFIAAHEIAKLTRLLGPALTRTVTALDGVQTADPALQDGRAAWHSVRRMYARIATLSHTRLCPVMRDYVRSDYKPSRAMRRASRVFRVAMRWDTTEIDLAMAKAIKRMVALGVPAEQADGFDGEIAPAETPADSGAGKRDGKAARAAQAPAPSSPLASLIAAR